MSDENKAVHDLTHALRDTVNRHIDEYDLCLAEVLGCFEVIKSSLCKEYSEENKDE